MGNHKVIRASGSQTVRYSMYDFIEFVRSHPVIWDRYHEGFHNRERREEAWHNVARKLYANFDGIKDAEKQNIVQTLTKRWKNTRDSYLRAYRLSQSNEAAHTYIYEKELDFLRKADKGQEEQNSMNGGDAGERPRTKSAKTASKRKHENAKTARRHKLHATTTRAQLKKRRASLSSNFSIDSEFERVCSEIEEHLQEEVEKKPDSNLMKNINIPTQEAKTPTIRKLVENPTSSSSATNAPSPIRGETRCEATAAVQSAAPAAAAVPTVTAESASDPDQAFFDSIKPVIRKMNVDQKLDFQIEILKLLKNFRSN